MCARTERQTSMTRGIERRASTRFEPEAPETYVQVMDWAGTRITKATLLNVSTGGALICTHTVVVTSQRIRVRFENVPETGWIVAEAVHFRRPQQVGIRFHSPCSPELVHAAVSRRASWPLDNCDEEETLCIEDVSPNEPVSTETEPVEQNWIRRWLADHGSGRMTIPGL